MWPYLIVPLEGHIRQVWLYNNKERDKNIRLSWIINFPNPNSTIRKIEATEWLSECYLTEDKLTVLKPLDYEQFLIAGTHEIFQIL
jgi:hypothetical protein